jgi:ATP-dependent DNA helicase DinG
MARNLKTSDYIIEPVRTAIRDAVRDNNGAEVFFIGKVDENLQLAEVEPHAFGSSGSVPVLLRLVEFGDVVLHNHPDGDVTPSDADVETAAALGDLGVGSYVIDNECEKLHVIVHPFRDKGLEYLKKEEIFSFFLPGGSLAEGLPEYEHRPQQVSMAEAVIRGFNEDRIAVIEAGTGTGKSLAYLIPAIKWSLLNKERVIVSTNTINLQEQLLHKDLPLLKEKAGLDFRSELMKGRQNYLCLRRMEYVRNESLFLETDKDKETLQMIFDWGQKTRDGSLSDLNVTPPGEIWDRVCCEHETCLRTQCRFYEDCFFYTARRNAARADIVIVNHHLLMADLALRKVTKNYSAAAILPPFKRIIFDEAHNVEAVATDYFTISITRWGILYHLGRLASRRTGRKEKGILYSLSEKLFYLERSHPSKRLTALVDKIRNEIITQLYAASALVDAEFTSLAREFLSRLEEEGMEYEENIKLRITPEVEGSDFWNETVADVKTRIATALYRFVEALKGLLEDLSELPEKIRGDVRESALETGAIKERIELLASNLQFFYAAGEEYCKWMEYKPAKGKRQESLNLCVAPIDVRENLRLAIYNVNRTVILTSATLTVQDRFDYMLNLLGLLPVEEKQGKKSEDAPSSNVPDRLLTLQLGTPFQFEKQAFVGVAVDFPDPSTPQFRSALEGAIMKAVNISKGRAFILFTSYRLMDQLFKDLSPLITDMGYPCLCQGQEPRHKLLQKFIREQNAVLFATASFWEGVDVKGESLECLVLTKLPFRVPTEPLLQARAEALEKMGRDPFLELDLPHAVIKFKQGFGRLIRSKTDRGAVLILDSRVASKSYGRAFLRSLPTKTIHKLSSADLFRDMKAFFKKF